MTRMVIRPPAAVFLDRDGTINRKAPEGEYVTGPDALELLPGAAAAIARLNAAGVPVAVVTNQRGIALGRMSEEDLAAVHRRLAERLAAGGARVDAVVHCPHAKDACDCRKPRPGMLLDAGERLGGVDLAASAIVGDAPSDMAAGEAVGMIRVLLADGAPDDGVAFDHRAPDLPAAVDWLLGGGTQR